MFTIVILYVAAMGLNILAIWSFPPFKNKSKKKKSFSVSNVLVYKYPGLEIHIDFGKEMFYEEESPALPLRELHYQSNTKNNKPGNQVVLGHKMI